MCEWRIDQHVVPVCWEFSLVDLLRYERRLLESDLFGKSSCGERPDRVAHGLPEPRRLRWPVDALLGFEQRHELYRRRSLVEFRHAFRQRPDRPA